MDVPVADKRRDGRLCDVPHTRRRLGLRGATAEVDEKSLRYRFAGVLPGRGYRKLMSRLVASRQEYFAIDRAIRNVWYREGRTGSTVTSEPA